MQRPVPGSARNGRFSDTSFSVDRTASPDAYSSAVEHLLDPVIVTAAPAEAAALLHELLESYQAELQAGDEHATIAIQPADDRRRGTVLYRVIQASRTVAAAFPDAELYLVTEDGSRWRLPPPAL